jgi:hypothetical protein
MGKRAHADMYSNEHYRQEDFLVVDRPLFLRFGEVRKIWLDLPPIKEWHVNADQKKGSV